MVELQILDLSSDDIDSEEKEKEFVITLYGKTIKDETVVCNISGFKPYFYLKIPKSWSSNIRPKICNLLGRNQTTFSDNDFHIEQFIKNAYNHDPKKDFLESQTTCEQSIDFYGFQCNEDKITLNSISQESGKMTVDIGIDDITAFSITEGENMKLSFALSMLHNICMYNKISKEIDIYLMANYPMKLVYNLGDNASYTFYLAPKIGDDE